MPVIKTLDPHRPLVVVHVGKTSGTVFVREISRVLQCPVRQIHHANSPPSTSPVAFPLTRTQEQFIITARHPIDRWVAAYNYKRDRPIGRRPPAWRARAREGFRRWKTCDACIRAAIRGDQRARRFVLAGDDHLKFGLAHYARGVRARHNAFVVRHEHIAQDFRALTGRAFAPEKTYHERTHDDDVLSAKSYTYLRTLLAREYHALANLHALGLISTAYYHRCCGPPISTRVCSS